nr:restriction endonuclease subunit S [Clostridium perfringens]
MPKESLLITCIGSIGKIAINKKVCAFNQQINVIVPNGGIFSLKYLAYIIMNNKEKTKLLSNSSAKSMSNISK